MTGRTDKAYAYILDDMETEATRKAWERMREPEHPILFPQTLAELIGRLHGLADEKGYDANALSRKTGIPEARINAIFNDGTISIGEADALSEAMGYELMRYPKGISRI